MIITNNLKLHIIIIIIIYVIYINYFLENKKEKKEYDFENLDEKIKNIITDRINILKHVSYEDWIKYNEENKSIVIDNKICHVFIFEYVEEPERKRFSTFVNKVFYEKIYENMLYDEIVKINNDNNHMSKYKLNTDLIKSIYFSTNKIEKSSFFLSTFNKKIAYSLNDDFTNKTSVKQFDCLSEKYIKDKSKGVIGIYYETIDIENEDTFIYYQDINKYGLIIFILITFIISIIIDLLLKKEKIIPIIFLYLINFYMLFYISKKEHRINYEAFIQKYEDINKSTLSIAFLITISTFIINFMQKNKKIKNLYYLNIALFSISMIFLLASLYKVVNYNNIHDMRKILLFKQLFYNLVVFINIFIIIIYIYHFISYT